MPEECVFRYWPGGVGQSASAPSDQGRGGFPTALGSSRRNVLRDDAAIPTRLRITAPTFSPSPLHALYFTPRAHQSTGVQKILVIDDDAKLRRQIIELLTSEG